VSKVPGQNYDAADFTQTHLPNDHSAPPPGFNFGLCGIKMLETSTMWREESQTGEVTCTACVAIYQAYVARVKPQLQLDLDGGASPYGLAGQGEPRFGEIKLGGVDLNAAAYVVDDEIAAELRRDQERALLEEADADIAHRAARRFAQENVRLVAETHTMHKQIFRLRWALEMVGASSNTLDRLVGPAPDCVTCHGGDGGKI
jgi:hypothetical protein